MNAFSSYNNLVKICLSCYRYFDYRKKWEKNWPLVKYCSQKCRKNKLSYQEQLIEGEIKNYLAEAFPQKIRLDTIKSITDKWSNNSINNAIRKLYVENIILVYDQFKKTVSPLDVKGPYCLMLKRKYVDQ